MNLCAIIGIPVNGRIHVSLAAQTLHCDTNFSTRSCRQ